MTIELGDAYQPKLILEEKEVKALYRLLNKYYIPYEDSEANEAVNKLMEFVAKCNGRLAR